MSESEAERPRQAPPRWLDYLRLMRLPNVFTALADVLMGFALVRGDFQPSVQLLFLLAASACLYTAGMVLNDVFDIEVDRRERPQRPLPSGRISLRQARWLGFGLLALGWLAATAAGPLSGSGDVTTWRGLAVGTALALCILAYDGGLKHTPLGPWAMGACRLLNVWLGMTAAEASGAWPGWQPAGLCVAAGIGLYIVGVTWFARREVETSPRLGLATGLGLMVLGWVLLGWFPLVTDNKLSLSPAQYQLLLLMLAVFPLRRVLAAVVAPSPARVQAAVKQCIMTLILMDAAVVMAVAPPWAAIVVVSLLIPMMLLGRWVYST